MRTHLINQRQQIINLPDNFFRSSNYLSNENPEMAKLTREQRREISTLKAIGLENYEIQYIIQMKKKEQRRQKWLR